MLIRYPSLCALVIVYRAPLSGKAEACSRACTDARAASVAILMCTAGSWHDTDMVGQLEAAVDWPGYQAQSVFAALPPVSACTSVPAHTVNVVSPSPQGYSMRMSQPVFWQHGMQHQNPGEHSHAIHAGGRTSDPRLSMLPPALDTSTSLPASFPLDDLETTYGQSLGWARYCQHCCLIALQTSAWSTLVA